MLLFTIMYSTIQNIIICKLRVFSIKYSVHVLEIPHIYNLQTFKEFLYGVYLLTASSMKEIVTCYCKYIAHSISKESYKVMNDPYGFNQ